MTKRMHHALGLLRRAAEHPGTDTGVVFSETYYDSEVHVAYIHWRTAEGLARAGYINYGDWDPEGQEIILRANA